MAEQDQWCRCGSGSGRPQNPGDIAEAELAFDDALVEVVFRGDSHGRAFRECSAQDVGAPASSRRRSATERRVSRRCSSDVIRQGEGGGEGGIRGGGGGGGPAPGGGGGRPPPGR